MTEKPLCLSVEGGGLKFFESSSLYPRKKVLKAGLLWLSSAVPPPHLSLIRHPTSHLAHVAFCRDNPSAQTLPSYRAPGQLFSQPGCALWQLVAHPYVIPLRDETGRTQPGPFQIPGLGPVLGLC